MATLPNKFPLRACFCCDVVDGSCDVDCLLTAAFPKFGSSSFDSCLLSISHFFEAPIESSIPCPWHISYCVRCTLRKRRDAWAEISSTLGRRFQTKQVTVGASTNPTSSCRFKNVVQWSSFCTISRASTASIHRDSKFVRFSLDVRGYSIGLSGQHPWNGLAAVEISCSSFRQFSHKKI